MENKGHSIRVIEFSAPLCDLDTEFQTYGCRQSNPEICKKNGLENVCAFVTEDGVCRSPSRSWAKQYRILASANEKHGKLM